MMKIKFYFFCFIIFVTSSIFGQNESNLDNKFTNSHNFGLNTQFGLIGEIKHNFINNETVKIRGLYLSLEGEIRIIKDLFLVVDGTLFQSIYNNYRFSGNREMGGFMVQPGIQYQIVNFSEIIGIILGGGYSYTHANLYSYQFIRARVSNYDEQGYYVTTEARFNPKRRLSIGVGFTYTGYRKTGSWFNTGLNLNFKLD